MQKHISIPAKILKVDITSTDTTFKLRDIKWYTGSDGVDVNLSASDFGTKGYGVFEPNTEREEFFEWDTSTIGNYATTGITINKRGLIKTSPYTTEDSTRKFAHSSGSKVLLYTNAPEFYNDFANKDNDESITGEWTFSSSNTPKYDAHPTFTDDKELIDKKYADDLAIAGSPDASETIKGVVEIATDTELANGTGTGGTGAKLVASGSSFSQSATAGKIPVADSNKKIDNEYIGLSSAGEIVYSDGTELKALTPTDARFLRMNGTTPEWGGANLDEANTFFGATDITGSEAETLTDGSDASDLHCHNNGLGKTNAGVVNHLGAFDAINSNATISSGYAFLQATGTSSNWYVFQLYLEGVAYETRRFNDTGAVNYSFRAYLNNASGSGDLNNGLGVYASGGVSRTDSSNERAVFCLNGSTVYAITCDGSATTETALSVTSSTWNNYRIRLTSTEARFYVNGVLVATHTTNIPSSNNQTVTVHGGTTSGDNISLSSNWLRYE